MEFDIIKNTAPIILNDFSNDVDRFVRKVNSFNTQVEIMAPKFNSYVDGIGIEFNRFWVNKIIDLRLRDAIGEFLYKYLQTQPKFLRSVIDKNFTAQVNDLYNNLSPIQSAFEALRNENHIIPHHALERYFPQQEDGTYQVTEEGIEGLKQEIRISVDTPEQIETYDIIQSFFDAYDKLQSNLNDDRYVNSLIRCFTPGYQETWKVESLKNRTKVLVENIIKNKKNGK